jgi:hypothetical protein
MSKTWPSFVFPSPGSPLPESTSEAAPYDQSLDRVVRYLDSAVGDLDDYKSAAFGAGGSSVRVNDIIEPRWTEPDDQLESGMSQWVLGLRMFCLVCLGESDYNSGSPGCYHNAMNPLTVNSSAGSDDGIQRGGNDVQMHVPNLHSNPSLGNVTMACTIGMYLSTEKVGLSNGTQPMIMSELFMASSKPRTTQWNTVETKPYIYNDTYPSGYNNATVLDDLFPSGYPTQTPGPRVTIPCIPSRIDNCRREGWYGLPIGARVGIIVGAIAGTVLLLSLIWCCCRRTKYSNVREKKKPILLSELRAQQAAEDQTRSVGGRAQLEAAVKNAAARARREGEGELDVQKPPPGYHETINDQERMLANYAIQRDNNAAVPPPSYIPQYGEPSVPAPSRLNQRADPVSNSSRTARAAYPQLPTAPAYFPPQ